MTSQQELARAGAQLLIGRPDAELTELSPNDLIEALELFRHLSDVQGWDYAALDRYAHQGYLQSRKG